MPPAEATETTHSRKTIRCIKLRNLPNALLSILPTPKTTGHQYGPSRWE